MKLLLFDIDGTLLTTQGIGRQVLETALMPVLGVRVNSTVQSLRQFSMLGFLRRRAERADHQTGRGRGFQCWR